MSTTKLRKQPISMQIAYYEEEMKRLDAKLKNIKTQQMIIRQHIRMLSEPDAEEKYQKRMALSNQSQQIKQQKEEAIARNRARIEREIELCLRMNGKI